ncbi:MAG: hypothetical protein KJP04_11675 [Arenicella sp.]|nr:hypothetical protein [Arenicella sp.]
MAYIDCFNGDADGICALTQLRLANPVESTLITGVKRDIKLVRRVGAGRGDTVTILDVSLDKNRLELQAVLDSGAEVFYCDHHYAGEVPEHHRLTAIINTMPDVCTSLLINQHLQHQFIEWAIVGTFGDNLRKPATVLAGKADLPESKLQAYENLGIYINYNGYGSELEDLYFHPQELFRRVSLFASPADFIAEDPDTFNTLEQGYRSDMANACACTAEVELSHAAVYRLPNQPWARRVSGVFGNDLANRHPSRAHAVLTEHADGHYVVSVRAPLQNKQGADEICRQFETGGGRAAAAGINALPEHELDRFVDVFKAHYAS